VRRRIRALSGVAATAACLALLAGCADQEAAPTPPAPATSAAGAGPTSSAGTPSTSATTTALPGMPVPLSVGDSAVDASKLRSASDLPTVFGCPAAVPPIRLPATPAPTGATVPPAPEAVVCASALADNEALYLWYTPTPEAKLGALTVALDRARYVHAGPNWVAAGMLNPQMGRVGGEVYR
jgi:hypothetical protein